MSVAFSVRSRRFEVGSSEFLHAFFSTISYHLEPSGWGSRYPALLKGLYSGILPSGQVAQAQSELQSIREELSEIGPEGVIWDVDDPSLRPPWGNDIADSITSLANYFVTSEGKDLLTVLDEALAFAQKKDDGIAIV